MTTEKQRKANIKNAKKSTGPRTKKGKEIVSKNALKHGILSKEAFLDIGKIKEDREEFDKLRKRFFSELNPHNILEEMLVDMIFSYYWRLRRVLRVEKEEIRRQTKLVGVVRLINENLQADRLEDGYIYISLRELVNNVILLRRYETKVLYFVDILDKKGFLTENEFLECIKLVKSVSSNETVEYIENLNIRARRDARGRKLKNEYADELKRILSMILERVRLYLTLAEFVEKIEVEVEEKTSMVLPEEILNKILRYETSLERKLYKAIETLEMLRGQVKNK